MNKRIKVVRDIGIIFTPKKYEKPIKLALQRAGFDVDIRTVIGNIAITAFILGLLAFAFLFPGLKDWAANYVSLIIFSILIAVLCILAMAGGLSVFLYLYFNIKNYNRTKQIESILPDFLQLAAANMRSGMMIDKALWAAVRPQFGILSKEIEIAAKKTITGQNIADALNEFADKYDSEMLRRSMHLLIEGMDSGGKVADLLSKISWNLRESELMRQEMAASVVTYAIFISFTVLLAAPFLFGLSYTLLTIIQEILPNISGAGSSNMMLTFSGLGITPREFNIFVIVMLSITSFMSSMIISMIQKGNVKSGIKNTPIFIIVTIVLFFIAKGILGMLFGSLF